MSIRFRWAMAVTLAIVAVAILDLVPRALDGRSPFPPRSGGPLSQVVTHGYQVEVRPRGAFTDGLEILRVPTGRPGRILSIEALYDDDQALQTVGIWVVAPPRGRAAARIKQVYLAAPPKDPRLGTLQPAVGQALRSKADDRRGTRLLVGTRVTEAGIFERQGLLVEYEVGDRRYRDVIQARVRVCSKKACSAWVR